MRTSKTKTSLAIASLLALTAFAACSSTGEPVGAGNQCTNNGACGAGKECSGGKCVPFVSCTGNANACATGSSCVDGVCRSGCTSDRECQASGLICDLTANVCKPAPNPSGNGGSGSGGASGSGGSSNSGGAAGNAPAVMGDLVDDFEDGDLQIIPNDGRQGAWYVYNDANPGAHEPAPAPIADGGSKAMHVTGSTTKPEADAYGGVGVDFDNAGATPKSGSRTAYDLSDFAGISFKAKGTGAIRLNVITRGVADSSEGGTCSDRCFDSHNSSVTLTSEWQEHTITFAELDQSGWGSRVEFNAAEVLGLAFEKRGAGAYDFYIDDVRLYRENNGGSGGSGGTGSGGAGSGGVSGSAGRGGSGGGGSTSCSLTGSPSPGGGALTYYWFAQGTYQEGGYYQTACGHRGTAAGTVDTVRNIGTPNYYVAFPGASPENFTNRDKCGACIKITNGGRSVVATVIDQCPISSNPLCAQAGHLDLSKTAFDQLGFSVGNPTGVTWEFVPCPVTGNVIVRVKPGNPDQLYIENVILAVKSVTMNGQQATRLSYGAWDLPGNAAGATLTLTDASNRTLTVRVPGSAAAGQDVDTGVQFPKCN